MIEMSEKCADLHARITAFMDAHIYPSERAIADETLSGNRWQPSAIVEKLRAGPVMLASGTCFCRKANLVRDLATTIKPRCAR